MLTVARHVASGKSPDHTITINRKRRNPQVMHSFCDKIGVLLQGHRGSSAADPATWKRWMWIARKMGKGKHGV